MLVCANYTVRFFLSIFVGEHIDVLGLFALGWLSPTGNGETVFDSPSLELFTQPEIGNRQTAALHLLVWCETLLLIRPSGTMILAQRTELLVCTA